MIPERNNLNHVVRNGLEVVRHILSQADHRLQGMEQDLALAKKLYVRDPHVRLEVFRLEDHEQGSLGALAFDQRLFCWTLEPDSKDPARPRILSGVYRLYKFSGTKWKDTLGIVIPRHTAVLFHAGNKETHTEMCVLLGRDPGYLLESGKKIRAILDSRTVYKKFQREIVPAIQEGDKVEFVNLYR